MPRTMVLKGPRRLHLTEQPARPLQPGRVPLRSRMSGISHGTELSLYRGTSAPHRHAPLWDRCRLLYTDRVSVEGMLDRTLRFDEALTAYRRLDEHPQDAVKVALVYGEGPE